MSQSQISLGYGSEGVNDETDNKNSEKCKSIGAIDYEKKLKLQA